MDLSPFNLLVKRRWTFSIDSMSCFRQGDQMTEQYYTTGRTYTKNARINRLISLDTKHKFAL